MAAPVCSIKKHFRKLKDPRVVGRAKHRLVDLIVIALCAVIANSDDWPDISVFARKRADWFRRFLALPGGIPSHDTFERVFAALDHRVFERCCLDWLREAAQLVGVGHIAIDGKTLRGSASSKLGPLHLVSAWATGAHVSLGQVAVDGKSNEIDAIPKLLELLDLNGALVTIDAIGCQKKIAKQIVEGGGDYVLPVKGNQERLQQDIQQTVGRALEGELAKGATASYTSVEQGHGRREVARGEGGGDAPAGENGGRKDDDGGVLLHRQSTDGGAELRAGAAKSLGDREPFALAIGYQFPGGRKPDRESPRSGEFRAAEEAGIEPQGQRTIKR